MRTTLFDTPEGLGDHLAARLLAAIETAAQAGLPFLLGCPGGRTPRPVYRAMARRLASDRQTLAHLVIVMMDEYVRESGGAFAAVDPESHFSCRRFARDEIAAVLNAPLPPERRITPDRVWFPDPQSPAAYDSRIAGAGGIDFFILASGASDGHVAFNPQGSPRDSISRVVPLAEATRRDNMKTFPGFTALDQVPRHGVTVGIDTIARHSKAAAMLLWGEAKHLAFERIHAAADYDPSWPATVIAACRNAELLADRAAA